MLGLVNSKEVTILIRVNFARVVKVTPDVLVTIQPIELGSTSTIIGDENHILEVEVRFKVLQTFRLTLQAGV